ncbi:biosynthetic peptidoglycan transglycosylase [Ferroacidibacillus organovorans]|uniref:Glycosyl transferase n=1 Tax=Ferroacidibacillus organovorans TaxID=1765683 RepID=A0A101XRD8_9BACL|nr:biosynthetic peptidoglycan transglycosylase [Ferroacidibacillus organovorans]KUO96163.1 glycosyl transferase [Ferroacidibacillus organovorans]
MLVRLLSSLIKILLLLVSLVLVVSIGLNWYFTHAFQIAVVVRMRGAKKEELYRIRPLAYDQIPTVFRKAIISTEDRRFWWDPGIDPVGIARSFIVDVEQDGYVEGGSTITQQLVDNTLLDQDKTLTRKIRQAFYAIGLYDTMNKREIFTRYTNLIYYGNGAYGLYNASLTYFGVSPSALNDGELTMLAGIPNDPYGDDPLRSFSDARERQQIVLHNMFDNGVINSSEARKIFDEPIHLINPKNKGRGT